MANVLLLSISFIYDLYDFKMYI
jgi:hypothetical protein